ncbi:MAG: hypothetical protein AAF458_23115 [Pseudomonadota bacterium]
MAELREMAEEHGTVEFDGLHEMRDALSAVLTLTERSIDILSRNLDPRLFDDAHIIGELKRVALASRRARVRILVHDTGMLTRRDSRVWAMMRRLPTYFQIRVPSRDHRNLPKAFLIADKVATLYQANAELYEGQAEFYDPIRGDSLGRQFMEIWEAAEPSPDLRTMTM